MIAKKIFFSKISFYFFNTGQEGFLKIFTFEVLKDRICTLFFCHSHSHSHSHSALSNVYPVALESTIEDKHC